MAIVFDDLPKGHFRAILADPPWQFLTRSMARCTGARGGGVRNPPYKLMTTREICRLPIDQYAAKDCVLFLWAVWPHLEHALKVIDAWGFTYKTCAFSWMKADPYRLFADEQTPTMGLGYWTRANTEPCLLATRGTTAVRYSPRHHRASPRALAQGGQPDVIHERIERLVAGPYLELFARQRRLGWSAWGNEVDKFDPYEDALKSYHEGLRAIRERKAEGGPGWKGHDP